MIFNEIGKEDNILWTCRHCRIALPGINSMMTQFRNLEAKVDEIEKKVSGSLDSGSRDIVKSDKELIREVIREEKEEEAEIEARKLNVIIYSFPESEKNTMEDRRNDYLEKVQSVLTDNLHLGVEVESVVRLGTSARDRNRPRPVRFTVRDFETKRKVLNASKRLKNHENYSNVYFSPDLTRNQRKAAFELREERRRRLAQGEENLIIRRGRIITQGRPRSENY